MIGQWFRRRRRADHDRELDAELRFHIEERAADLARAGIPEGEARRRALVEFGGVELAKEECRDVRTPPLLESIWQDIWHTARSFRRDPRFTLSAIAALTLAIGAATAVFSVVDRSLFRPLPYRSGDRLVSIGMVAPMIHSQDWMFAGTYLEWSHTDRSLEAMTAWKSSADCDRTDSNPEPLRCAGGEAGLLPTLGVYPAYGRNFAGEAIAREPIQR